MYGFSLEGKLTPKHSRDILSSRIGIGLEKLDRNLYNPEPCYEPIGELGVKPVRIQSGWCRTESRKGVYDFSWLDSITDGLIRVGAQPWMCLCYGNELYTPSANNRAGSVGRPPIHTDEERAAWDRYVDAVVTHFKDRITLWEIWNEPDGAWCWRPEPNPAEYSAFALRTSKVIRSVFPEAKILTGCFCLDLSFLQRYMTRELAQITDYVTYHRYAFDVDTGISEHVRNIRAILDSFGGEHLGIIQGETGTQSDLSSQGALRGAQWTEHRQAKFLLRKITADLISGVAFTSWFSTVDIFENISTDEGEMTRDWYGFFGLLGEQFDDAGHPLGTYRKKEAFGCMQNLASLFAGDIRKAPMPMIFSSRESPLIGQKEPDMSAVDSGVLYQGFRKPDGSGCFVYWKRENIMTTDLDTTCTMTFYGQEGAVRLIDPWDGSVYLPDQSRVEVENGVATLINFPLRDYPLMVTFGNFADFR